tara:strand:- start:95 stop:304 length:210 start_codon:yes stop_codon:yes gene_type:complete
MTKEEIIERIQKEVGVSKEKAKEIFEKSLSQGMIRRSVHWKNLIDLLVVASLLIAGTYCLIKIILSYLY